jgi:hypothetical protein
MTEKYKPYVNKVLEKNEVLISYLVEGNEYLLEYNVYHENRTIKVKGVFLRKEIYLPPYIMTFFKTAKFISTNIATMFNEVETRYYIPMSNKIKRNSLERQAFSQSINKLTMDNKNKKNKNNIGNDLVKIYYEY